MAKIELYGLLWDDTKDRLRLEMACIVKGGKWVEGGRERGAGLSHHYEQMRRLLWPHLDDHRWHRLCRDEILKNKITVILGPGSSGKTHEAAWIYLCEYFCFAEEMCVLVSSTTLQGLELRVWGEIKMLFEKAVEKYPWLPGHLIDSRHAIVTDDIDESEFDERPVRDFRKGIIGIPCVQNGKVVGLSKYVGIKQKHVRLIADEASYMSGSFLSAFANLDKNADFRAVILGNPQDPLDPLGLAAEPKDGWTGHLEPDKTSTWDTRFMDGRCINLVGTDSPNFDAPEGSPVPFPYLISRKKIENTLSFFPKDSVEYYSQCVGVMKVGILARRVLTRDMCRQFKAQEDVIWKTGARIKIAALDAAYGGDRCVGGHIEFGENVEGKTVIRVVPPRIVPIRVGVGEAEDQIADWVRAYCDENDIPPENFFHDATGRGSLGTALARIWSAYTNPVEFGGDPTDRPVSLDMFIYDPKTRQKRLKTCKEHYSKFVTELWFSVRYAVESEQLHNLPDDVMEEFCMREWDRDRNGLGKYELESKRDMKLRVGRSPDLADWLSIAVEGARRRGFHISKLGTAEAESRNSEWLLDLKRRVNNLRQRQSLNFAA